MNGFYWLIDGALAGCGRPGQSGGTASLRADLLWLRERGIGALLSLTETPLAPAAVAEIGFEALHLPVDDLHPPTPDQLREALAFIDRSRAAAVAVAVHCKVGQGRTGTVLAAFLIRGGLDPATALRQVRGVCPGAVGSERQERALATFAASKDWLV
jgi:atypical dual specificity phosphatase